jgi:hypothetical protein
MQMRMTAKKLSVPRTGLDESARIYDEVPGSGGEPGLSAVVTGIFTITGVVVTAAAALLATWMKYKTDRRRELRKERRELYARFQHASAQMWDALFRVVPAGENRATPSDDAVRACPFRGGWRGVRVRCPVQPAVAGSHGFPASARVMASRAVRPWFAVESR